MSNKQCPVKKSDDSAKAVQLLPLKIPQKMAKYYQWMFNKNVTSEDSTKAGWVSPVNVHQKLPRYYQWRLHKSWLSITSECAPKPIQVLPVKGQWKLPKYYQCGFNKSCPGLTSKYFVKPVKLLTVKGQRGMGICREKWNEICWILKNTLCNNIGKWNSLVRQPLWYDEK